MYGVHILCMLLILFLLSILCSERCKLIFMITFVAFVPILVLEYVVSVVIYQSSHRICSISIMPNIAGRKGKIQGDWGGNTLERDGLEHCLTGNGEQVEIYICWELGPWAVALYVILSNLLPHRKEKNIFLNSQIDAVLPFISSDLFYILRQHQKLWCSSHLILLCTTFERSLYLFSPPCH